MFDLLLCTHTPKRIYFIDTQRVIPTPLLLRYTLYSLYILFEDNEIFIYTSL